MPAESFEVTSYSILVSREWNVTKQGLKLKIRGRIVVLGGGRVVYVITLDDASPVPPNEYNPASNVGWIFVPRWQFEWFRDLLRNEKPVYCFVDDLAPRRNSLFIGDEPVGEEEAV